MKYAVVCVRDGALGAYMRPFFAPNVATARRSFKDEVNREGSEMRLHPEDYELHCLGTWDDGGAQFDLFDRGEVVCRALDVVREVKS